MFTSIKEYKKHLSTLNLEQKLKHIDNAINELKEQFMLYNDRKKYVILKVN